MIQTTDAILEAVGKKQLTVAVLLYMSKVFDSMDHEILMTKVYDLGLSPLAIKWFRSYLQSRYQVVKIHNVTSHQLLMTCGVPQEAFWVRCFLVSTPELPSIPQRSMFKRSRSPQSSYLKVPIIFGSRAMVSKAEDFRLTLLGMEITPVVASKPSSKLSAQKATH